MHFKLLHLKNARKTLATPHSDVVSSSNNRRSFLRTVGLGVLAMNPVAETVKAMSFKPFSIRYEKNRFEVERNGKIAWSIAQGFFARNPQVAVEEGKDRYTFKIQKLTINHSDLHFTMQGSIYHDGATWMMDTTVPELNIAQKLNFIDWLDGRSALSFKAAFDNSFVGERDDLALMLTGECSGNLNHLWNFNFHGKKSVKSVIHSCESFNDHLVLRPFGGETPVLKRVPGNAVHYILPQFDGWQEIVSGITFHGADKLVTHAQPDLNLLASNSADDVVYKAVWVSGEQPVQYWPDHKLASRFDFNKVLFYSEFQDKEPAGFYLGASLVEGGQWVSNPLGSFQLKNGEAKPAFEAFGKGLTISGHVFEPKLMAFQPYIGNAIALPSTFENAPAIRIRSKRNDNYLFDGNEFGFHPQDPPAKRQPAKANTAPVTRNIPQLNLNYDDVKFLPKKALKIKVLRPEDLMVLEFEFHNFKFSNKGQAPYVELDDPANKGLVIIYFQTQHTLEQAWFEASKVPNYDSSSETEIKLPAMQIRARKSRLAYELAAGHPGFPLIMDELLDWSKFDLRVHPRAWVKLENILTKNSFDIPLSNLQERSRIPNLKNKPATLEYNIKLEQQSPVSRSNQAVYRPELIDNFVRADKSTTLKPTFSVAAMKLVDLRVAPIPPTSTSIEAPTLMYISPNQLNDFTHKTKLDLRDVEIAEFKRNVVISSQARVIDPLEASKGEIAELWHTRMGVKLKDGKTSIATFKNLQTIRVLWADDATANYQDAVERNVPFMASLDANNRHKLVHTTSNYTIPGFKPFAVPVKKLMLTSLGSYLDWHAFFDVPSPADTYLNIIEWEHLATLGRDHYVKIVEEGYLFPFGHRAAVVKVTERKFHKETRAALNRQRMYIVVLEKEVFYNRADPEGKFIGFPFQAIRIETLSTPDIDNPEEKTLIKVPPAPSGNSKYIKIKIGKNTTYNFYITVGGEGFKFSIIATDKENKEHQIRMPLVFLENRIARDAALMQQVINVYNPNTAYALTGFNGQKVAYSESFVDNDTAFETDTLLFGGKVYPAKGLADIKFHPVMQSADVYIKAIEELTGSRKAANITLEDDNNPGKVFARVKGAVVDFSGGSDKSGGFLSPNMAVNGLSKLQGPIGGDIDDCKNLIFKADKFFEALADFPVAKIFGVIDIFSLLGEVNLKNDFDALIAKVNQLKKELEDIRNEMLALENQAIAAASDVSAQLAALKQKLKDKVAELLSSLNGNMPKMPNLKVYTTDLSFFAEYKWQPEFKGSDITVIPSLLKVKVANPLTALTITSLLERPFDTSQPSKFSSIARFEKFGVDIVPLMVVNFNYLEFRSGTSAKTDVKVDIDKDNPIKFQGVLTFVNNLQSIIPSTGFSDDGPYIDLKPTGVTAGFNISIPDVTLGMCMITNISLGAAVTLPFTGAPLTIAFNFCRRENPFLLTISIYGGGGFFKLVSTLKGVQSIEAAFEFGAAVSLNVGVASGAVSVMGGFYFKVEIVSGEAKTTLTGYIRINGHLSILGLITVSMEFYLALTAIIEKVAGKDKVTRMEGEATLKVKVEVLFFSKTVSVTVRKEIMGADADPKFVDMVMEDDWNEYCLAFAS